MNTKKTSVCYEVDLHLQTCMLVKKGVPNIQICSAYPNYTQNMWLVC
jgi:hypothetical protein